LFRLGASWRHKQLQFTSHTPPHHTTPHHTHTHNTHTHTSDRSDGADK
jgi:hypothetical protein